MAIVDELIAILGYRLEGEADRAKFQRGLDNLNSRLDDFAERAAQFAAVATAAVATGMGALAKSVVSTSAQFEGFQTALVTIEGSAAQAEASMQWIADFGRRTPYELEGVTEAFIALKSYGIDPIANDALRTLGDTASAMNKPLEAAVEAFADATTFEFERLKEFGMRATQEGDEVTFRWTENGKELQKVVKKNSEDVRAFLLETMGQRFGGAMERQSKTFNGMMSNLGDSWSDFQRRIGEAGFFDAIKARLSDTLSAIARLDEDGSLDRWAKTFSDGFVWAMDALSAFVDRMTSHFGKIKRLYEDNEEAIRRWGVVIGAAFGFILARARPFAVAVIAIAWAVDGILEHLDEGESLFEAFGQWLSEITPLSEGLATNLGKIGVVLAGMVALAGPVRILAGAVRALATAFGLLSGAGAAAGAAKGAGAGRLGAFLGAAAGLGKTVAKRLAGPAAVLGPMVAAGNTDQARGAGGMSPSEVDAMVRRENGMGRPDDPWNPQYMSREERNLQQNLSRMNSATASPHPTNDNRNQSVTANTTINQTVNQATDAPAAAAEATGRAVSDAATRPPSRIMQEGVQ